MCTANTEHFHVQAWFKRSLKNFKRRAFFLFLCSAYKTKKKTLNTRKFFSLRFPALKQNNAHSTYRSKLKHKLNLDELETF